MAKLALIFLAIFFCVQLSIGAQIRDRRRADEPEETTTQHWTDAVREGFGNVFNEQNFNKTREAAETLLEKGKIATQSVYSNLKGAFDKATNTDQATTTE